MSKPILPLLVISSRESRWYGKRQVMVKGFVSSLLRSLFSGRIVLFRNDGLPLFRVDRKALDEVFLPVARENKSDAEGRQSSRPELVSGLCNYMRPEPRQWVIMADAGSMALRNPDHLIPPELEGPHAPPQVDLLWVEARSSKEQASPGLWAVRGEHLPLVLERWKEAWSKESGSENANEEDIWTRVVQELPLRKRTFEKGEVVAPRIGAVDWEAVSNAAFVTVPDWPEKEAWKFLQALYFGTYLGDETGLMLNILEA